MDSDARTNNAYGNHARSNVIVFPLSAELREDVAKLDRFVLDELAGRIGFAKGACALYLAGIRWVGDLVARSEPELRQIPGIGRQRIAKIKQYLEERGLRLGAPNRDWIEYRKLRPLPGEVRSN